MRLKLAVFYLYTYCQNERKSEQAHIPHAPTLLENAVYNDWQFQSDKKRVYKLHLKRIKSAFPVIMSFITTKFQEILFSSFSGVVLTNCFSSIYHFRQISKFKKGHCSQNKRESKCHVDMHIYTLCPLLLQSFRKFC